MTYTVTTDEGKTYELKPKTISIMDKLEQVLKIDQTGLNIKQKYQKLMDFVIDEVGKDGAKEILGSDKVTEIDLGELEIMIKKIVAAYNKPIEDYQLEQMENSLNQIPTDKIVELTKAAETVMQTTAKR